MRKTFLKTISYHYYNGRASREYILRQQISHYLFNSRGVTCHPNQIIVGSSTSQLLDMITNLLKKEEFIIEQPSYPPIKHTLDKNYKLYSSPS